MALVPLVLGMSAAVVAGPTGTPAATATEDDAAVSSAAAPPPAVPAPSHRSQSAHQSTGGVDERVRLISKELDLDPGQESRVKEILLIQRAQLIKLWNDESMSSAERVGATQAISQGTADRIRALLTDEQKQKYLKARPHETPVGAPGADVEKWITATQQPLAPPPAEKR